MKSEEVVYVRDAILVGSVTDEHGHTWAVYRPGETRKVIVEENKSPAANN